MADNVVKKEKKKVYSRTALITCLIIFVIISWLFVLAVRYFSNEHLLKKSKAEFMTETVEAAGVFAEFVNDGVTNLSDIANDLAGFESLYSYDAIEMLRNRGANTSFTKLHILHSDGNIVNVDGEIQEANEVIATEIFEKKSGVSVLENSEIFDTEIVIYVPIIEGRAELLAALDLSESARYVGAANVDLQRIVLFRSETGQILTDVTRNSKGNEGFITNNHFKDLSDMDFGENYSYSNMLKDISKEKTGFFQTTEDKNDNYQLVCFAPVYYNNWYLMQYMSGDVIKAEQDDYFNNFVSLFAVFCLLMMVVITFSFFLIRTDVRKREYDMAKVVTEEQLYEARNQLIASVSGELKTPINSMIEMMELCEINADNPERVRGYIDKQRIASEQLLLMIDDMIDSTHFGNDNGNDVINLGEHLRNIMALIRGKMQKKNITYEIFYSEFLHENVYCSERILGRVLLNVLDNAEKNMPDGGNISIYLSETEIIDREYGNYEYVIKNNGSAESGLGMLIADEMVKRLGGRVVFEAEPEQGNTVTISLRLKLAQNSMYAMEKEAEDILYERTVIYVDEDTSAHSWMDFIVTSAGMECRSFADVDSAVAEVNNIYNDDKEVVAVILGMKSAESMSRKSALRFRNIIGIDVPIIVHTPQMPEEFLKSGKLVVANKVMIKPMLYSEFAKLAEDFATGVEEEEKSIPDLTNKRILVVDDHKKILDNVRECLQYTKAEIDACDNAEDGLEKFFNAPDWYYSIILVDTRMPKMDGLEMTKEIRKRKGIYSQNVPVIAMVANTFFEEIKKTREAGMNSYVVKPLRYDDLYEELRKWF